MKSKENNDDSFNALMNDNPEGTFQIAPGLSAEEMNAIFFNEDALLESPEKVYRLVGSKDRYYYTFDEKGDPTFYTSVTTMIKFSMPTSPHLIKWIADMGHEEAKIYAEERADYGTFMHKEIAELLINKRYDTNQLKSKLKSYIDEEKLPVKFINHESELKKDLMSFAQFMIDHKVKPLAIEIVMTHPDGYAGAVDLVCLMTVEVDGFDKKNPYKSGPRAGQPREIKIEKEIIGMVDFKSGRKGFFEENEIQLEAYKTMWQRAYPKKKIQKIFNWAPKNWRGSKPTYTLKDQTEAKSRQKLKHLVNIAQIEGSRREVTVTVIDGVIDIEKGIEGNVTEMSLLEAVKKSNSKKQQPKK